jgi:hypothetical protein
LGEELLMPSKLEPAVRASGEDCEPLVFCAGVLEDAAGPGGIGSAGCAVPGVWLGGIDRSGGDLSWWTVGPESGEGGTEGGEPCARLASADDANAASAPDPAASRAIAKSSLTTRLQPPDDVDRPIVVPHLSSSGQI